MSGPDGLPGDTSVIITCFNEKAYVLDAVHSVLAQTALDRICEIVVVDDGSTDGSVELLGDLAAHDSRVRLVRSNGAGVAAARNLALEQVRGCYVAILDGDDLWTPNKLEQQLPLLDRYPWLGLVYSDFYEFDDGQPEDLYRVHAHSYVVGYENLLADYYLFDGPVIPSSMIVRKAVFDEVGCFNTDLKVGEDTEICLRIAERYEFQHVGEALVKKRRHPQSLSSRQDRLWPNHKRITEMYAERNPSLRALATKRLSRRAAKVGWGMIQAGERRVAATYLARSMMYDPRHLRVYAYFGLAIIPKSLAICIRRYFNMSRKRARSYEAS